MSQYDIYPAVDSGYNFPPEVRQGIAAASEVRAMVDSKLATGVKPLVDTYIGSEPSVVAAAAAAVDANPKLTSLTNNSVQYKPIPPGPISTWTGVANSGRYRLPVQANVDAIPDRPIGAGPAIVKVDAVGSTASTVEWREYGSPFRIWDRLITTTFNPTPGWRLRESTKKVLLRQTVCGGGLASTLTDFGGRLLIDYGVTIERFQIGIQNFNFQYGIAYNDPVNLTALSIGEAREDSSGNLSGAWVDGTQRFIDGEKTIANGLAYLSPMIEYKLDSAKKYFLSYGLTAAGQVVHKGLAPVWTLSGSAAVNGLSSTGTPGGVAPMEVFIIAEVSESTRVDAVLGDSLSVGNSATHPVRDSWFAMYCRAAGSLPMFLADSGDAMTTYVDPASPKLSRLAAYSRPDALHWAIGSNDTFPEGQTLAGVQSRFNAAWKPVTDATTKNIVLYSILPRLNASSPNEPVRKAVNSWLEMDLPGQAAYYVDIAASVTASSGDVLDPKWPASPTNFHLRTAGYGKMASAAR